jgi:hypothetical protein
MPQHPRSRRPRRRPPPHRQVAVTTEPAAPARALVQAGIITAAALDAANDLATAAASVQRLGQLASGIWRALSGELATAAERLDRQVQEHLDDLERRAQALQVDPEAALTAGMAAGHLEEHRATLERLLPSLEENVCRLAVPDILFGFVIEGPLVPGEGDDGDAGDEHDGGAYGGAVVEAPLVLQVWLFFWPAPLSPAGVSIAPRVADTSASAPDEAVSVEVNVGIAAPVADELARAAGLPSERLPGALSELAMACWTAHQLDERDDDDDGDGDDGNDDD